MISHSYKFLIFKSRKKIKQKNGDRMFQIKELLLISEQYYILYII